jgi:3-hydroxyisobutyrate dehydrogenase
MKIGFVGIGNIGAPIAGQLLRAGHDLVVHDIRRAVAEPLLVAGAAWSDTPAAVAAECEAVATCLPGPAEMEQVCLGANGIVAHLQPGALYIDHTTNAPGLVRRVHALLAEKGVAMLDAPVSGGMEGAQTRDLLVIAAATRPLSPAPARCSRPSRSGSCMWAASAPARSPRSCTTAPPSPSTWSWPNAGPWR